MDSCPTLDEVYQAVYTLYHNPDTAENGKASQWLGAFQKSIYSWKIADEILHEKRDLESCYLAAQTMRSKIQLSFHELPPGAHDSLRDSLLQHVSQINDSTNPIIITQLCLALSDLALQMSSWQRPVIDLITKFGTVNVWPLLEILTLLPEELNSSTLRLGANRRHRVKEDLMTSASSVSEFLTACLAGAGENTQIHTRIFRCFTSWVSIRAVSFPDAAKNVVVGNAFQVLTDIHAEWLLHSSAMECVCALFGYLEVKNDQAELEEQLFSTVMTLEKSFSLLLSHEVEASTRSMDQCRSNPKVSGMKSKYMNYCQLFTELGESFLVKILDESSAKEQHFAIKIFDLILTCVEHHDYQMAEITFNLWYRLSEELYHRRDTVLTVLFKPHIEKLIAALCQHCQMEPDQDSLLDDDDDFADFRKKVSELIKDVVFIVGSSNCFHFMFKRVNQPGVTWQSSEAALYVMQTVAKNIVPEENDVVPQVLEAVWSLPENTHITVKYTSVLLLGELCDWIEDHPHLIEHVLNFLLYSLQQPLLASAAAVSLQSICTACRNHMVVHFNGLLQIIQTLDSFNITNEAAVGLLKGVASIVGKMPEHQLQQALKDICYLQINPLCQLVNGNVSTTRGTKTDPVVWLDRLTVLVRHSSPKTEDASETSPCLVVINDIWPILSKTCIKYQADARIMERWCRCLRFTVRSLGKQSVFLFQPLVEQIVQLYQTHQHSCFLYLGSILVDELPAASEERCVQGLLDMLQAFIPPTFTILQEPKGLLNHPDTIDDFFRLNYRFLRSLPVPYLQGPAIASIVQCALLAISLDHRDANSSVMKFLFELIHCGWSHQDRGDFQVRHKLVEDILIKNGQPLISNLIHACVFCLHSYMFAEVADVIMELLDCDRTLVSSWLEVAIGDLPKQNSGGSDTATHDQLAAFHHTLIKADGAAVVKHALREFVVLFR